MKCPSCKTPDLVPTEIEKGLVSAGCNSCDGVLLPLINYRYWLETIGAEAVNDNVDQHVEADDSKSAKICPKCSKLMSKYRVGLEQENRVELCSHCDEVWLDSGEWQLLKSLELHDKLPNVFTESWQRQLRVDREKSKLNAHFESVMGEQDFEKVRVFKEWLDTSVHAADIKHYLTINFDVS
ncbi:MAG: zf-TFIIB domain-containing protein [Agarilytica sp.]